MKTDGSPLKKWLPAVINSAWTRPEGYVFSGTAQDSALPLESTRDGRGYSASFAMLGGAKVEGVAFGLLTQGQIAGRVWQDDDYDGVLSESENGLRGAAITLLDGDGAEIAQTQTARSGEFTFDQLMPGAYSVRITLPEGYVRYRGRRGFRWRNARTKRRLRSIWANCTWAKRSAA